MRWLTCGRGAEWPESSALGEIIRKGRKFAKTDRADRSSPHRLCSKIGSVCRGDRCVRRVILVRIICTNLFHPFIGAQKCRCARPRRVSNFRIVNGEVDSESLAPVIGIDRDPGSYRRGWVLAVWKPGMTRVKMALIGQAE